MRAFAEDIKKQATYADALEPGNGKKPTSNEQMKKLFDSGELGRAESKNPAQLQRTTYFYLGLFFGRRERENQCLLTPTILSLQKSMKELNILRRSEVGSNVYQPRRIGDSEDESDAKIFSVPDSETGQQSAPHIQLKLMPRQPQQV